MSTTIPFSNWKINEKRESDRAETETPVPPQGAGATAAPLDATDREIAKRTQLREATTDPIEVFISSTRRLQQSVQEANRRAAEMEKRWKDAAAEREYVNRQAAEELQSREKRINELTERLNAASRYIEETRASQEQQYRLLSSYKERELLFSQSEASSRRLKGENRELSRKLTELRARFEQMKRELETERSQREKYEAESNHYRERLEKAVDRVRELHTGHKELTVKTASERALIKESLSRQRSELNTAVERMARSIDEFRSQTTSTLESGKRETEARINEFGRKITDVTDRIDAFGRQVADMYSTVQLVQNETRTLKYKVSVVESQREKTDSPAGRPKASALSPIQKLVSAKETEVAQLHLRLADPALTPESRARIERELQSALQQRKQVRDALAEWTSAT